MEDKDMTEEIVNIFDDLADDELVRIWQNIDEEL